MENERKFVSLLSDYGFKVAFADESDTLFLRKALQAILKTDYEIKEVIFSRNEKSPLTQGDRGGLLDLQCTDERGYIFIVEMQFGHMQYFLQRSKFYTFFCFNTLVVKGNYDFSNLPPIYCIGFLARNIFPFSEQYYHYATLKNQEGEVLDEQMVHIIIEIGKFDKKLEDIDNDLDKLIYLMKNLDHTQGSHVNPIFFEEEWIKKTIKKLQTTCMTSEERMHHEMELARRGSEVGQRKLDIRRALAEGREESRAELEKLKADLEAKEAEKLNIAKSFKESGIAIDIIAQNTGLSISEIEKL